MQQREADAQEDVAWRAVAIALRDYWPPLLTALTVVILLSGFSYFHGYLGGLGFAGVAPSLPPTTYLLYGGVAALLALAFHGVMVGLLWGVLVRLASDAAIQPRLAGLERATRDIAPGAAILVTVLVGLVAWQWMHPVLGNVLVRWYPYSLWAFGVVVASLYAVALVGLRGAWRAAFIMVILLVGVPSLTFGVGASTAERLVGDPDAFPRVLAWENASDGPTGYVLAHQEGERLYLVLLGIHVEGEGTARTTKYTRATTALLTDFERVDFIPAGVTIERFRLQPEAAGESHGTS